MANLTGTWLGTYWQDDMPTRFEMSIAQGGNALSGNILDDGNLGEATMTGESDRAQYPILQAICQCFPRKDSLPRVAIGR
jgi:hypothetical protein